MQVHANSRCSFLSLIFTCLCNTRIALYMQTVICRRKQDEVRLAFSLLIVVTYFFQISTWPLSVQGSNGTYLQQPVAFLPDASALAQTPSRRLDKSDKLEVRDDLKNVDLNDQLYVLIMLHTLSQSLIWKKSIFNKTDLFWLNIVSSLIMVMCIACPSCNKFVVVQGCHLRAATHNTCCGWVCLIFPWCFGWNYLLLIEFTHKVTGLLQVTQDLMTVVDLLAGCCGYRLVSLITRKSKY